MTPPPPPVTANSIELCGGHADGVRINSRTLPWAVSVPDPIRRGVSGLPLRVLYYRTGRQSVHGEYVYEWSGS